VIDNQEMNLSVNYWEGMVTVSENSKQIGKGYLELTGY
jgi:predicted secreted hydrolase